VTFAHVAGVPLEETLGALAPVAVAVAAAMRATVYRLRHREGPRRRAKS
jgi:hypothetical protein